MLYHLVMYLRDVPHAYAQSSDINAIASADQTVFLANHGDSNNESRGNQSFTDKLIAKSNKRSTRLSSPRRKSTERLTGIGTAKK